MRKYVYLFYELTIIILYFLFILLLIINNNVISKHKLYAFNIDILCNIQDKSNFHKIKNISLLKLNNKSQKLYSPNLFKFNKFLKYRQEYNNEVFYQYINTLNLSGFINSLNYKRIILNIKYYLVVTINYNPIIKSIKINNYKELIIPSKKLANIFYQHIGLPKNYQLLQYTIKQIIIWYKLRGFEWIRVRLYSNNQINQINIVIDEGKIISNKIICDNYTQISNYKYINSIIESELNLTPGTLLNKSKLINGIKRLKQIYCIKDMQYNVDFYKNGLYIKVKYSAQINNHLSINYFYSHLKSFIKRIIINIHHIDLVRFNKFNFLYFIKLNIRARDLYNIKINLYSQPIIFYKYIKSTHIQSLSYIKSYNKYFTYYINLYWLKLKQMHFEQICYISYLINFFCKSIHNINGQINLINQYYIARCKYNYFYIYLTSLKNVNSFLALQYRYCIFSNTFQYKIKCNSIYYSSLAKIIHTTIGQINYNLISRMTNYQYNFYKKQYYINQFIISCLNQILDFGQLHKYCKNLYLNINYNIINTYASRLFFYNIILVNTKKISLHPSIILQTKHGLYMSNYIYLYMFHNYLNHLNIVIHENYNFNFMYHYLGFGMQVKTPLKQMSYIRLEYIINHKKKLYIFMDKFAI